MNHINSQESFMSWLINFFADKFPRHAILKGGMVLKIIGCPRSTNDIDYVFVPYKSKKDILPMIEKAIHNIPQLSMTHTFHSTNLRLIMILTNPNGQFQTQVEISVSDSVETEIMSTNDYALSYNNSPHIIHVIRFDVALAHKMAAWNERELMRDLYDIYFIYHALKTRPNIDILKQRLTKINYSKNVKKKKLPTRMSIDEFCLRLQEHLQKTTQIDIETELEPLFERNFIIGLNKKIQATLSLLIQELSEIN
jgi:predicted nucleotidyltransferase component of viral defense system